MNEDMLIAAYQLMLAWRDMPSELSERDQIMNKRTRTLRDMWIEEYENKLESYENGEDEDE